MGFPEEMQETQNGSQGAEREGAVACVLQIHISAGKRPDFGLRTCPLAESSRFHNIPSSSQTAGAWQKKKKKAALDLMNSLSVATVNLGFCLVGWRTLIPS